MARIALLLSFLLLLPSVVQAEEEDSDPEAASLIRLSGTLGLTGFQDMVDARTPKTFSIRGGARYNLRVENRDLDGAINAAFKRERQTADLYVGASLFGLVDAAVRLPYIYDEEDLNLKGIVDAHADRDIGWGDVDLSAKITLGFGPLDIAPYAFGRLPTGEPAVEDLAELEYGVAATFSFLNEHVAVHGNLAGLQREEGLSAVRFRVGVSFVVYSGDPFQLRIYGYGDGIEYEGSANTDLDLECGAQLILFRFITAEIGFSMRLIDANFLDDTTKEAIRFQTNSFERHFEDDGIWGLQFGVGVVF